MDVQQRTLGRTGEKISCVGVGGFHLGKPNVSRDEAVRLVRQALDHGLTFLDNCWDYNDGQSESRMGVALRDGYRQKAFLMTKFDGRTKESASAQIDESLARLQTDHVDLLQLHEVIRFDDADRFFAEGGAAEALMAAKKAGKTRYVGFTGHKDPRIHLYMLSQPTSVVITGIDSQEVLDQAVRVASDFKPLTDAQIQALLEKVAGSAASGEFELFKTSNHFDSTALHPDWLGPETQRVQELAIDA